MTWSAALAWAVVGTVAMLIAGFGGVGMGMSPPDFILLRPVFHSPPFWWGRSWRGHLLTPSRLTLRRPSWLSFCSVLSVVLGCGHGTGSRAESRSHRTHPALTQSCELRRGYLTSFNTVTGRKTLTMRPTKLKTPKRLSTHNDRLRNGGRRSVRTVTRSPALRSATRT